MNHIYSHNSEDGLLADFFKQKLLLNMFVVCDEFGLLPKPELKYELDINYLQSLEYYNRLSKTILFLDFYIHNEARDMTLLKNDKLGITIVLVDIEDSDRYELEFIGVKTIGDLVGKYPDLLNSKVQ